MHHYILLYVLSEDTFASRFLRSREARSALTGAILHRTRRSLCSAISRGAISYGRHALTATGPDINIALTIYYLAEFVERARHTGAMYTPYAGARAGL